MNYTIKYTHGNKYTKNWLAKAVYENGSCCSLLYFGRPMTTKKKCLKAIDNYIKNNKNNILIDIKQVKPENY